MSFFQIFYYAFIILAVAVFVWIFDDPFWGYLFQFIICVIIAIPIVIAINYFKTTKAKNKNEYMTPEEKKKEEIKEWSRRNGC